MLHLPGHHGVRHAFSFEDLDKLGKLAQADPVKGRRQRLEGRIGLLADCRDRHSDALAARGFQYQEREAHVAGNQRVLLAHLTTPRSDDSMNSTNSFTSGVTGADKIASIACVVFIFDTVSSRKARCSASM